MKNSKKEIKGKLDRVFSLYIRLRDSHKGKVRCPLCGKIIDWQVSQNMHFIKRSNMKYRFNEENCYAGCVGCNVYLNGNYQVYTMRMIKKFGIDKVQEMINDKEIYKIKEWQLEEMLKEYVIKCEEMAKSKKIKIDLTKILWKKWLQNLSI